MERRAKYKAGKEKNVLTEYADPIYQALAVLRKGGLNASVNRIYWAGTEVFAIVLSDDKCDQEDEPGAEESEV